ncbi:MAG: aminopeptidase P family protein, partial [Alphaproteobacteria bacterium]|nr:aminopeptidase P family protein [Alphaproteobacteria bacterium]
MALQFERAEYASRIKAACAAMAAAGLDGLLMYRQESMYYLTGYDTFGFVHYQCLYLGADGTLTLLTRKPDLLQAKHTSVIEDIRIWVDQEGADPYAETRKVLEDHRAKGKKVGIELEAYGLTARKYLGVAQALQGFCALEDASFLVSQLRLVKSPAELAYVRRAAELADAGMDEARRLAVAGAYEGDILAAMQGAVLAGGGDDPANENIIGSGRDALLCRYFTGRRHLDPQDLLTLEFAGTYRHYHACWMRTLAIGKPDPAIIAMHKASVESLMAARDALKPGRPIGEVFDAHARVLDRAGHGAHKMNACGYSLGALFAPNWMDWPMFYHGNPVVAAPGMVFFIHIIVYDEARGLA